MCLGKQADLRALDEIQHKDADDMGYVQSEKADPYLIDKPSLITTHVAANLMSM